MGNLYILNQAAKICKNGDRISIVVDEQREKEILLERISSIFLFGNIQLTTQTLSLLLKTQIPTAFFTTRGKLKGRLIPIVSKNNTLRQHQYSTLYNKPFTMECAAKIVHHKIVTYFDLLKHIQKHASEDQLDPIIKKLQRIAAQTKQVQSLDSLRSVEGQASKLYFSSFSYLLKNPEFAFTKRMRRPPPDPINSLLSFSYALLVSLLLSATEGHGLDPYLGYLHQLRYGRPSLVLDLMEVFRASIADRFVLRSINLKVFKPNDFVITPQQGCRMKTKTMSKFFLQWEKFLAKQEFLIKMNAYIEGFIRYMKGNSPYPEKYFHQKESKDQWIM